MDLNIDQMKELIELFEDSQLTEISVGQNDYQVTLKKDSGSRPKVTTSGRPQSDETGEELAEKSGGTEGSDLETGAGGTAESVSGGGSFITSPIVGTFYRSPAPEEPPYKEVGEMVEEGDTVCVVEAMKVMNEVKAEKGGKIVEICVEDGDPVEYGQKLFKLAPADKGS